MSQKIRIFKEEQILDLGFRKKVLEEIRAPENTTRKSNELKKYEIYRDKTIKWIMEKLVKDGLKAETLKRMENRASNLSICRKIINKLARSYNGGVMRVVQDAKSQLAIDALAKLLNANQRMKKSDRYRQLHKNCQIGILPELCQSDSFEKNKYKLKLKILSPWQYDAIEDYNDHEYAKCVIVSDFLERNHMMNTASSEDDAARHGGLVPNFQQGNRVDEIIADQPEDSNSSPQLRTYIWWTDKYHLTTDDKGSVIPELTPLDYINPIQMIPYVNVADDQDGEFWAQGGDDLVDGSILVNTMLTDMFSIAYIQGWGQMVITGGRGLPKLIEGGPHNAIILEQEDGDPTPSVTFESANPPLDMWMRAIEQYVALLLTTNDLAPSAIAGKLDASSFPSGIAMLVEQSEATNNIEDKQNAFQDSERQMWARVAAWQNLLLESDSLVDEFKVVGPLLDSEVSLKFMSQKQVVSEQEKLNNLKIRKDLGISTQVDLIRLDNPDLTEEEAKAKLLEIQEERVQRIHSLMVQQIDQQPQPGNNTPDPFAQDVQVQ